MYSVYIIDDDNLIIDNLLQTIPWMDNGFEVIGSNTNSEIAIKDLLNLRPDVVFSDLKMPNMDGNTLIKTLQEKGLSCEYIMLSAFSSFDDARNFFLLQGFDYLLKPLQQSEAEIVLERLSRKLGEKQKLIPTITFSTTNSKSFDELVQYIMINYAKRITLDSLSSQFHISANYICSLFAKYYNSSLTIFLTSLRMKEAERLITETDKSFKEVAILCGYPDYFYFCKIFKRHFNITPSQFKEQTREKDISC